MQDATPANGSGSGSGARLDAPHAGSSGAAAPAASNAGRSTGSSVPPDASTSAGAGSSADAGVAGTDAATAPADAGMADAGTAPPICSVEGVANPGCTAQLCTANGATFAAVLGDEPWMVGGLAWTASVCERPVGWQSGASSDNRLIFFALSLADVNELRGGAPLLIYWGGPSSPPLAARACPLAIDEPLSACPEATTPLRHPSTIGCRGPLDSGCEVCRLLDSNHVLSASDGADWYNVATVSDPACGPDCPSCAACTYRDEQESRALAARPDCEPCSGEPGIDSCFDPLSCDCWCPTRARLRAHCPALVP